MRGQERNATAGAEKGTMSISMLRRRLNVSSSVTGCFEWSYVHIEVVRSQTIQHRYAERCALQRQQCSSDSMSECAQTFRNVSSRTPPALRHNLSSTCRKLAGAWGWTCLLQRQVAG